MSSEKVVSSTAAQPEGRRGLPKVLRTLLDTSGLIAIFGRVQARSLIR